MGQGSSEFADLIRAVRLLAANDNFVSRAAIAETLGIELTIRRASVDPQGVATPMTSPMPNVTATAPEPHGPPRSNPIPANIRFLQDAPIQQPPDWLERAAVLRPASNQRRRIPAKPSLLWPIWTRALIVTLLATIGESGEIDIPALIRRLSSGESIDSLPLVRLATLARGVHCWVDDGPAMEPFNQDQNQLITELANVAGLSRVTLRKFRGVPERDVSFVRGAPHLLLSDLGRIPIPEEVGPMLVTENEFLHFAHWVRQDLEAPVVALTPLPVCRYSDELRAAVTLLCWDRQTSVQSARRAVAETHG